MTQSFAAVAQTGPSNSRAFDVASQKIGAISIVESARYKALDFRQSYGDSTNHDWKKFDFDGRVINAGPVQQQPFMSEQASHYVPLRILSTTGFSVAGMTETAMHAYEHTFNGAASYFGVDAVQTGPGAVGSGTMDGLTLFARGTPALFSKAYIRAIGVGLGVPTAQNIASFAAFCRFKRWMT